VEQLRFEDDRGRPFRITLSAGLATFQEATTPQGLVTLADQRLYRAKHFGRNRVCAE
jgi:PleD family two-component response regulator